MARELERVCDQVELQHYRAVEAEQSKWEDREKQLVEELRAARQRDRSPRRSETEATDGARPLSGDKSAQAVAAAAASGGPGEIDGSGSVTPPTADNSHRSGSGALPTTFGGRERAMPHPYPPALATALLAQQLPPLNKFSGEEGGETFQEWIEQLEMVAFVTHWDARTKLVNLTTRLRGQAYAFYRSCSAQQRGEYSTLVAELTQRFTPVRLQAVQSSLFHKRRQKQNETVDLYAQDLRRLFYLAYPRAQQGTQETEEMGRSVLASQFVSGLRREIRVKLAGMEGSLDQLLVKARFEEAKFRDLADSSLRSPSPMVTPTSHGLHCPFPTPGSDGNSAPDSYMEAARNATTAGRQDIL